MIYLEVEPKIKELLSELEQRAQREKSLFDRMNLKERKESIQNFSLIIGPETGQLLLLLICTHKSKNILELGSGIGYSTIWLALGAKSTEGKVTGIDYDVAKLCEASTNLSSIKLSNYVKLIEANSINYLERTNKNWDFVLIDIWKDAYTACFDLLWPSLNIGGIIVVDNLNYPKEVKSSIDSFLKHVKNKKNCTLWTLNVGSGLALIMKT